jgi:hypothetical protein
MMFPSALFVSKSPVPNASPNYKDPADLWDRLSEIGITVE